MSHKTAGPRTFMDGGATWRDDAACQTIATDLFFPSLAWAGHVSRPGHGHGPVADAQLAAAKAVCQTCPVRDECLAYAIDNNEPEGVWGGTDPIDRVAIRKARRMAS
jgi:WhiB family redox-sensing transcriptional regulator